MGGASRIEMRWYVSWALNEKDEDTQWRELGQGCDYEDEFARRQSTMKR